MNNMKLVDNLSKKELFNLGEVIGEAFLDNELFHEFGDLQSRKKAVMRYMHAYVTCVYESRELYQSDDENGYIGLAYSDKQPLLPKMKMLVRLITLFVTEFSSMRRFMKHVLEIANGNLQYSKNTYLEVLMVCVKKEYQGKGITRELVTYAKEMAARRDVPLLFDTDMEAYAKIYQHYGCKLYNTISASNGVVRYNLVWKADME